MTETQKYNLSILNKFISLDSLDKIQFYGKM